MAGAFMFSFIFGGEVWAVDSATLRVKNNTNGSYTTPNDTYANTVRAEPSDILSFRFIYSSATPASSVTITLPSGLTYAGSLVTVLGSTVSASASGQNITFTFSSATSQIFTFNASVANGSNLNTNHTLTPSFTTNGSPAADDGTTSTTNTITTGPVVTGVSPSSGGDSAPNSITITGHGFAGTTAVALSNGTNISLTGATITDTSISGGDFKIPGLLGTGAYWIKVTTTVSGTALTNNADSSESVQYTVTDGTEPTMSGATSYIHSTGVLTLAFNETIDVSQTNLSKITLYDASSGGNSQVLTGATVSTTDSTTVTITLTQAQKNTVSGWGVTASNLYVQIAGSGIYDLSNNGLVAQGSRTAITTWTKDTTVPTATLSYAQNSASTTSVKAGSVTITATFSEPISATPNIAIDQPGATDIAATAMTGSSATWTYAYTINAVSDGTATITITNAPDYANNALGTVAGNTFAIDTLSPTPAISTVSGSAAGQTALTFSWTPTYTASDFSTYKFFYRATSGVTSANGTAINKNTSGYSNLGTAATNSLSLSGLSAGTTYYAVIYICDTADNCSAVSNEAGTQTNSQAVVSVPVSGGGGSSAPSAPSTASSAGTITASGGAITTMTSSGASATVSIPANTVSGNVNVAEASSIEKQAAPLATDQGVIIGNSVFNIQLSGVSSPTFTNPVTLEFVYDPAQLGGINPNTLSISYFSTTLNKWISLVSSVNTTTHKVAAQTTHFTLFAITTVPGASGAPTQTSTDTAATAPPSAPDSGQILGTNVGVYPNGALLKAPNSPAVWYIVDDKKHVIPSAAVFNTRFNWSDIVSLPSSKQLDLYETGEAVKFAPNTLVKEQGVPDVYRVAATGDLQGIVSMDVFLKRAYKISDIIEVEPNGLAGYSRAAYIADVNLVYTGELVSVPQKKGLASVYYIEGGQAREFKTRDIFDRYGFKLKNVRAITASQLKAFPVGTVMPYPDGTLLKGKGATIYIISEGKKRPVKSGKDLDALLYNRKRIKAISDADLNKLPSGAEVKVI